METSDLDFLKISDKIKKKLICKELDTIEKISTHYLENAHVKEIDKVQDEILRTHLSELGVIETAEIKPPNKWNNLDFGFKNVHSHSDPERGVWESSSRCLSSSEETEFFLCTDSFGDYGDNSFDSSVGSSIALSVGSNEGFSFHLMNLGTQRKSIMFDTNEETGLQKEEKKKGDPQEKKKGVEDHLWTFSNFTKDIVTRRKIYRMENSSINDLLSEGIESGKIYYFYGSTLRINRTVLINMLFDVISGYNIGLKNGKGNVIYIYFCYVQDVKSIHDVVLNKVRKWQKKKKKKKTSRKQHLKDFLSRIYILRIQEETELFSFLSSIKSSIIKEKNKTQCCEKDKKKEEMEFQDILAIGILNFSELISNINLTNTCSYFYVVRELKVLAYLLCIPILIFDEIRSESAVQLFRGKKGELDHEQEMEDQLKNQLLMSETRRNNINSTPQEDEEQLLMEQQWGFDEMDEFEQEEKDRIWSNVNEYIKRDEDESSKSKDDLELDSENIKETFNVNTAISDSETGNNYESDDCEVGSDDESDITFGSCTDHESSSKNEISESHEKVTYIEGKETAFRKPINNVVTTKLVSQYIHSSQCVHDETVDIFCSNVDKQRVRPIHVPFGIYTTFDIIVEVEVIKKGKNIRPNRTKQNYKIIRFTLFKSKNDAKHFYCHILLKGNVLCDF